MTQERVAYFKKNAADVDIAKAFEASVQSAEEKLEPFKEILEKDKQQCEAYQELFAKFDRTHFAELTKAFKNNKKA